MCRLNSQCLWGYETIAIIIIELPVLLSRLHLIVLRVLKLTCVHTSTENSDYVSVDSQELIFLSGQSSSNMSIQCGELVVLNDTALEANETISIRLTSDSPQVNITAGRADGEVIIQEDDNDCKYTTLNS
jgi:hypothetical protein